MHIMTWSV